MYKKWQRALWVTGGLVVLLVVIITVVIRRGEQHLVIAAGTRGGESFALSQAIAEVVRAKHPNMIITVRETGGSSENLNLLVSGKADFATVQADIDFQPGPEAEKARLVAELYSDAYQLLASSDGEISEVSDLRGKRIAVPEAGSGQYDSFRRLAEHYGLGDDQLEVLPMSSGDGVDALRAGKVDALFKVRAIPNQMIQEALSSGMIRLVPIRQVEAMRLRQPALIPGVIAKGSYGGEPAVPGADLPTACVPRLLIARGELDLEQVATITAVMFEHRWELAQKSPLIGSMAAPGGSGAVVLPIHPGAKAFFDREKPSFLHRNAEPLALVLSMIVVVGSALAALRAHLERIQKDRADRHNQELVELRRRLRDCSELTEIQECEEELYRIFEVVVDELDKDSVNAEGFQYFSFTWEAVHQALLARREELA